MTKEQLIELVKFTAGKIVAPTTLNNEDAESIVDDFVDSEQLTIPDVVRRSEQLPCEHENGTEASAFKCDDCGEFIQWIE